jgi:hypothetical protein
MDNLIVGSMIFLVAIIIVGLGFLIYNDAQNTYQLQKTCIENQGTYVNNLCLFGVSK